jgi:glutamate dehydrogenase
VLLTTADGAAFDVMQSGAALAATFMAVWGGATENDAFNALTLRQGIGWRDIAMLRALARYLRQAAAGHSTEYVAQTLVKHAGLALSIVTLFHARFDPSHHDNGKAAAIVDDMEQALSGVPILDEDRIIRRYVNLVGAVQRTNFFQREATGGHPPAISFKIDSHQVDGLPLPLPRAEIFVYAPDAEGIHLRFGRIARGGIRWSDRPEDYRTEILNLAKAQNVKNVVIVPVGAKGGFVPKQLPAQATREVVQAEGLRIYKLFIDSLLDLTDNLKDGRIVPPPGVLRRDGDDPYLVVAADKGTAAFSDTANDLSAAHGFWLDDAFASGGSAGYDHKKMGITARGAWEAVKRHFREIDLDIQSTPFTVLGVGDMSGDVFGNGMLLSPQIRLLAAFDHRDIFFDPDPDPHKSLAERRRLFLLPRSSWQDYDRSLISPGGGIFSRTLKAIALTPQLRTFLAIERDTATPQEVMNALLRAQADLLWFGGIGNFVKAAAETHADAGDRTNDLIRVNANELRIKVIGEGANLAVTQKGRIEYARGGGRINTDAIDNSAGVNSSDLEVNIKIGLSVAEAKGRLDRAERNRLLAAMTDEVAGLVMRNNYLQTLSLSITRARGSEENGYAMALMHDLEDRGLLDRKLEALPSDAEIVNRDRRGETLTRPELSVLMAFSKIALYDDLLNSSVPDDPFLSEVLKGYFPQRMQAQFADEIETHRLRREIVATVIANGLINRGGPAFVSRLRGETAASAAEIAAAFAVARHSFRLRELHLLADHLDAKVKFSVQIGLYLDLQLLVRRATQWFLRNADLTVSLAETAQRYQSGIDTLAGAMDRVLPDAGRAALAERGSCLEAQGVPEPAAKRLAALPFLARAADVVLAAARSNASLEGAARALYGSAIGLAVDRLIAQADRMTAEDFYERLAINRVIDQVFLSHQAITTQIMSAARSQDNPWAEWCNTWSARVDQAQRRILGLLAEKDFGLAKLAVAQGALADLATATSASAGKGR